MTLEIKRSAEETTIKVVGGLDNFTSPVLEKMINKIACDSPRIVLDLNGLDRVSDMGMTVLLDAHERMSRYSHHRLISKASKKSYSVRRQ